MALSPTPDNVRGWFATIWPAMQAASPLSVALILVLWVLSIRWFSAEITRVHGVNHALWERLLQGQREQIDLAWRCYQESERPRSETR